MENNHLNLRKVLTKGMSFDNLTQTDIDLMLSHMNSFAIKSTVARFFKIPPDRQAKLAAFTFWTLIPSGVAVVLYLYGWPPMVPVLILCSGVAFHLHKSYIPSIMNEKWRASTGMSVKRKLAFNKIKTLLFLCIVVCAVFELLSGNNPIIK